MDAAFLPGVELSRALYTDAVHPLLPEGLPHAAALLGHGSEVLGLDTERSTDHDWGPRLQLFVEDPADRERVLALLDALPDRVRGWPTRFVPAPGESGIWMLDPDSGPRAQHRVEVMDTAHFFHGWLGFHPGDGITTADWLATPTQRLAGAVGGALFHDTTGELTRARERLAWYPDDVWRYVLACQWQRIAQEEPFVGRGLELGDDLGTRVLAARLVRDVMVLALLLSRRYPPYSKWLGSAFARLPEAGELGPLLTRALHSTTPDRDLAKAYAYVLRRQNRLALTAPLDPTSRGFHARPYTVIGAERVVEALREPITDPELAGRPLIGAVDQSVDNTDFLTRADSFRLWA